MFSHYFYVVYNTIIIMLITIQYKFYLCTSLTANIFSYIEILFLEISSH